MQISCKYCQYKWETNSEMDYVTCPNCRRKTPKEIESIASYDFIVRKFKNKDWESDFEDMIEFYLDSKRKILENVKIKDINRWLAQVIIVLEIAYVLNPEKFQKRYENWQKLIGRKWVVDLDNEVVTWIN